MLAGVVAWALIFLWLWWELKHASTLPLPSPNHLPCGQCFWIVREQWLGKDEFPANLPDQLVISMYCPVHNTFVHKRWKEKHLDDKGLKNPWQTDVDNYRGFLE